MSFAKAVRKLDVFKTLNIDEHGGEGSFKERDERLLQKWRDMPPAEKSYYKEIADDETKKRQANSASVSTFVHGEGMLSRGHQKRQKQNMTTKHAAVANTLRALTHSDNFKCGFQIGDYSSAIKPELVSDLPDKNIEQIAAAAFGFLPNIVKNPERKLIPFRCCALRHGGLCPRDTVMAKRGNLACKNLYSMVMRHELKAMPHDSH